MSIAGAAAASSRPTGMPAVGDVGWGDHLCQFYRTQQDLLETLVPFFAAGLREQERCIWITAEPLRASDARAALRDQVADLDERERCGQIEIVDREAWSPAGGRVDADEQLARWEEQEAAAMRAGYAGLRISGHAAWLEAQPWTELVDYEARVHQALHGRRIIALCSYCLERCGHRELVDVMRNHRVAVARHRGRWDAFRTTTAALALLRAGPEPQLHAHSFELFRDGTFPAARIAASLRAAIEAGAAAGALARPAHLEALRGALGGAGVDLERLREAGQLLLVDAEDVFEAAWARPGLRTDVVAARVLAPASDAIARFGRIRMYGELVDLFTGVDDHDGALALERWWNAQLARYPIELHCGYRLGPFTDAIDSFRKVCHEHEAVHSTSPLQPAGRLQAEVELLSTALARETRLRNELQPARDHLMVLQRVMSRLGEVVTLADLSAVVVGEAEQTFGAARAAVLVEERGAWRDLATGDLATAPPDAMRPVWLCSAAAVAREEPRLAALSPYAAAVLPLVVRGLRIGALALGFANERGFDALEQALATDVAQQIAHALDRARAYEAAAQASRAKDEFLAMLGHELRNPLSPILTATQLMRLRGDGACAKERTIIERQARNLVRIVDDLLDVSRIARDKIVLERRPIDLAGVIAEALEQASPAIEEQAHRLEVEVPPGIVVDGDPARMAQVFANLLTNAAKYTRRGGEIRVSATASRTRVAVEVRDNGQGIEPALLPHVFEVFVQGAQGPDRARGGLGVGLAVARSIVAMHGGEIRAESDGPGRGTTLVVELPCLSAPPAPRRRSGVLACVEALPARLLLVDDNQDAVELLALSLTELGHDVRAAYDPRTALAMARERPPDIALLDIGLPEMDGYALAAALRAQQPGAPLALIALSGYGQPADRSRSVAAGFSAHLVKPVDLAALQDAISRASTDR
jgi:signal transduction histidine kinase/ActR/RegA family two-component response regulator